MSYHRATCLVNKRGNSEKREAAQKRKIAGKKLMLSNDGGQTGHGSILCGGHAVPIGGPRADKRD